MGTTSKKEYLLAIWDRYQRVGRRFKTKILDEFVRCVGMAGSMRFGCWAAGLAPDADALDRGAGMTQR